MTTPVTPDASTASSSASRLRTRALGVVGAVLAAVVVWIVAVQLLDVDLKATTDQAAGPQPVGLPAVIVITLVVSLLGWALLALLEWRTARARTIWTWVAVAVLVLSLAGPLTSGEGTASIVTLVVAHLSVAAVLVPVLRSTSPTR